MIWECVEGDVYDANNKMSDIDDDADAERAMYNATNTKDVCEGDTIKYSTNKGDDDDSEGVEERVDEDRAGEHEGSVLLSTKCYLGGAIYEERKGMQMLLHI